MQTRRAATALACAFALVIVTGPAPARDDDGSRERAAALGCDDPELTPEEQEHCGVHFYGGAESFDCSVEGGHGDYLPHKVEYRFDTFGRLELRDDLARGQVIAVRRYRAAHNRHVATFVQLEGQLPSWIVVDTVFLKKRTETVITELGVDGDGLKRSCRTQFLHRLDGHEGPGD